MLKSILSLALALSALSTGCAAVLSIAEGAQTISTRPVAVERVACTPDTRCVSREAIVELDIDDSELTDLQSEGWTVEL